MNAECRVNNHAPSCACIPGYEGNPFTSCYISTNILHYVHLYVLQTLATRGSVSRCLLYLEAFVFLQVIVYHCIKYFHCEEVTNINIRT